MSIGLTENISLVDASLIASGKGLIVAPSRAHLTSIEKKFLKSGLNSLWGDSFFTIETLIKNLSNELVPQTSALLEKALVLSILKGSELRYFNAVRTEPVIVRDFCRTISLLRSNLIGSDELSHDLTERGSLKEFDLLTTYRKYEEAIQEHDVSDAGKRLTIALSNISSKRTPILDHKEIIIFTGFEVIPPGLGKLITVLSDNHPNIKILLTNDNIPLSPIYEKFVSIVDQSLRDLKINRTAREHEEDKWRLPCSVELHICRSTGNEARFISERLLKNLKSNIDTGIVTTTDTSNVRTLLASLKESGLLHCESHHNFDGLKNKIRQIVQGSDSRNLDDITAQLAKMADELRSSFRNRLRLPQLAADLETLKGLFSQIFDLQGIPFLEPELMGHLLDTGTNIRSAVNGDLLGVSWFWWDDGIYSATRELLIPAVYQGSIPPEASSSQFFQDTSFILGNAPSYFAYLFPTSDISRAREAFRFRKYLMHTKDKAVLSLSRISAEGKETHNSGITALLDLTTIDEGERLHFLVRDASSKKDIQRRISNCLKDIEGTEHSEASIINDPEIKSDIKKRFEENKFSVSQLDKYAKCPYQYYLNKVLCLDPIEVKTPEIDPKDRGKIIHRVLELFYKNENNAVRTFLQKREGLAELEKKFETYIDKSFSEHQDALSKIHPALVDDFKKKARITCISALELELNAILEMTHLLLPVYTEWAFGRNDTPPLVLTGRGLEKSAVIVGVVDRIDMDDYHDTYLITDYKTGKTEAVLSKIKKGKHLQLPIYVEAVKKLLLSDKKPVGAFLFSLKDMIKSHGLAMKDSKKFYFEGLKSRVFVDDEEWNELIETALTFASQYINDIRNSLFFKDRESCNQCNDYRDICRFRKY